MLLIKGLSFRHRGSNEETLKDITFDAHRGAITTILGPNGSGKSTLFKCILGLWDYHSGVVSLDGRPLEGLSFRKRAKLLSFVPQDHEPAFPYSVFDVVLMGRASYVGLFSAPGKKDYEVVERTLRLIGIDHLKDKPYTKISGGERQLTLIARSIAQETSVMLLDEPTSHLDFRNQINVLKRIKEIAIEKKLIILMTLHDPNLSSLFSDKVVVLNSGVKVAEDKPLNIISADLIRRVYQVDVVTVKINSHNIVCPVL